MISRRNWPSVAGVAAVGVFALLASSCGDGGNDWTPPTAAVAPTPPTVEPPPSSGGSGASSCPLGEGTDATRCERGGAELWHYVNGAIDYVVEVHPEYFNLNVEAGRETGQYLVLEKEAYIDDVLVRIREMGLCAERADFDYEVIQVKEDNELSEDYDIYLSDGFIRRGGAYRQSCTPASFPVPRPDWAPPVGSGCGKPYPPPIGRFALNVHFKNPDYWTLDTTALVGHDVLYCKSIGFKDGRSLCPVRPEGHPERKACEKWAVGRAVDTGRYGPTWTLDGELCTGPAMGCKNSPDSQYLLFTYRTGLYEACAENKACGRLHVDMD